MGVYIQPMIGYVVSLSPHDEVFKGLIPALIPFVASLFLFTAGRERET